MMEKIKKHDNLILWVTIAIFSALAIFSVHLRTSDELWNFANIYKMANGYQIYKDANVIITPIFFWIGEILFNTLGANYFIFRVLDILIYSTMILIIYNILKQLKIKKSNALLYTLIIHYFMYEIECVGANYNVLAIMFVLLGVYISLKYNNNTKKFIILNGIIMYLVAFTKQNIGAYYVLGTVIMQFFTRKDTKAYIKNIIEQGIIFFVLTIITLGVFAINGNLIDFINYAFLGIGEFGTRNIKMEMMNISFLVVVVILIICNVIIYKKIANKEQKQNIIIFSCIGIPMLLIVYPIINRYHIMVGILLLAIELLYLTDFVAKDFLNTKITKIVISFMTFVFILISIYATIRIIKYNPFTLEYSNPYYGIYIKEELQEAINNVNNYISDNDEKVIIFSKEAALYNIPKKRSNGAMDLPFLGNLGYGGEDSMLEKIKAKVGYKILLTKENFYQESDKITNYIREHYEKIGEIEEFEIYEIL